LIIIRSKFNVHWRELDSSRQKKMLNKNIWLFKDRSCDLSLKFVHDKGVDLAKNQTQITPRDLSLSFVHDKGRPKFELSWTNFKELYEVST